MILRGDAFRVPLRNQSVDCCVTSPPYFGQRNYGDDPREVGASSLAAYLDDLMIVQAEVARVLNDRGLWWLNIGDTAAGSGGSGGDYNAGGARFGMRRARQGPSGIPPMNLCLVPARVQILLQEAGWLVRRVIVWDKERTRRASIAHERAPLDAYEIILMLAKQRNYRSFMERLPERGTVWHFPPATGPRRHAAPFPLELPRRCILASTEEGDIVFDPFVGGGTTLEAAQMLGRVGVGIDLYA